MKSQDGGVLCWKPGENCQIKVPVWLREEKAIAEGVQVRDAWDGSIQDIELEVTGFQRTEFTEDEERAAVQSAVSPASSKAGMHSSRVAWLLRADCGRCLRDLWIRSSKQSGVSAVRQLQHACSGCVTASQHLARQMLQQRWTLVVLIMQFQPCTFSSAWGHTCCSMLPRLRCSMCTM